MALCFGPKSEAGLRVFGRCWNAAITAEMGASDGTPGHHMQHDGAKRERAPRLALGRRY